MKKLTYIATIAGSLFLTTSCVDLTQEPQSFITEEEYFASMDLEGIKQAATALYTDLWNGNYGFNCRIQRINVCADDITYRAAKANNELANYYRLSPNITANTADFDTTWSLFFAVINNANKLINNTVIPSDAQEAEAFKNVLGEAYFLRGLAYFYLVRMYGDVPLILKGEDASTYMPRTAVAEIYDKAIVPSLQTAVEWLPETSRNSSSTPSKWAAEACLADVYMTMAGWPLNKGQEYYSLAATAAKDIIDNSGLYLTSEYSELWKEANKTQTNEVMFALHHSATLKTASNYGKSYYPSDFSPNAGWADYYANEAFFLSYPDDDRKAWNYMTEWDTKSGHVTYAESADKLPAISKYYDYDNGAPGKSAQANGITCIYRYADVLLMHAEAAYYLNKEDEARDMVNKVRQRARQSSYCQGFVVGDPRVYTFPETAPNVPDIAESVTGQALLEAIWHERRLELAMENIRTFDLIRTGRLLDRVSKVKDQYRTGGAGPINTNNGAEQEIRIPGIAENIQTYCLKVSVPGIGGGERYLPLLAIPDTEITYWNIEPNQNN